MPPEASSVRSARRDLAEWRRTLRAESHRLLTRPGLLFQLAANQPAASAPAIAAGRRLDAGLERRAWLRWIDKPLRPPSRLLTLSADIQAWACAFSPDGRVAGCASPYATVLWDADTGAELDRIDLGGRHWAFSPCGTRLVATSGPCVVLYERVARRTRVLEGHTADVSACRFSPDGRLVASASHDGTVRLWNTGRGEAAGMFEAGGPAALACDFAPDARWLIAGYEDGRLRVWPLDGHAPDPELPIGDRPVASCAVAPDGRRVAASSGPRLGLWDTADWTEAGRLDGHHCDVIACAFSADGGRLASLSESERRLYLWDARTGSRVKGLAAAWSFACSPGGDLIAATETAGRITLWNSHTGRRHASFTPGSAAATTACAFSPDGERLISAAEDGTVSVWSTAPGPADEADGPVTGYVAALAFSPDGSRLAAASSSGDVLVRDASGRVPPVVAGHAGAGLQCCAFAPGGEVLLAGGDAGVLVKARVGGPAVRLAAHDSSVTACAFAPDGRLAATADDSGEVLLWDVESAAPGARMHATAGAGWLAFSVDGRRLLVLGSAGAGVWEVSSRRRIGSFRLDGTAGWGSVFALSPDGVRLLTGSADGFVLWDVGRVWSGGSPGRIATLDGRVPEPTFCGFLPDGSSIATDVSGELRIWAADGTPRRSLHLARRCLAAAVDRAGRILAVATGPRPVRLGRMGEDWFGPGFPPDEVHLLALEIDGDQDVRSAV